MKVSVLVVMLMAFTWPTLAAFILSLVVLCPGPSTSVPEPWLETYSSSPPVGGTVTCTGNGWHSVGIRKGSCLESGAGNMLKARDKLTGWLMMSGTLQANCLQHTHT